MSRILLYFLGLLYSFLAVFMVADIFMCRYCTVLYCTVLYCTVMYCTVLYCTVRYCTVLYCTVFMVADIFMRSIDSITSATKRVLVATKDGATEEVEVPVWDGTLANL